MKLVPIPEEKYDKYRLDLMFDCYKWDPQFLDHNTVAKHILVLTEDEYNEIKTLTESIDKETITAEGFLNKNPQYTKRLGLSKRLSKEIASMDNYNPDKHIRLMRYDFHPTVDGKWAVSEVNSDVPGGFAEASLMPQLAIDASGIQNCWFKKFSDIIIESIVKKVPKNGKIMFVHCTSYSDDRQVMQFLGDQLTKIGFKVIYGAADHIHFKDRKAISILDGNEGELDAIIRFTPIEWIKNIRPKKWSGYFNTETVSCNHPIAIFAQTKKFPFVWDILEKNDISMTTWRSLLPETIRVKDIKGREGFIFKPAYGRVGEKIGIKESCTKKEFRQIMTEVKLFPWKYIAQKRFISKPLIGADGKEYHLCLGSYTIDGKQAGLYARISDTPRIDSNAADIPVVIERRTNNDK